MLATVIDMPPPPRLRPDPSLAPKPQVLRDMALFVEVAKQRNFSRAADRLGMPISSLSRRITLFENALGLRLLDRTTRKIVLTSYGEAYLAKAMELVEEAQRTFDDLVAEASGPGGHLRIAATAEPWLGQALSRVMAAYADEHPAIAFHVDLLAEPADLVGGRYDLAVAIEEPKETSFIARRIAEVENGLYAAPTYLATHGRPGDPRDLDGHRLVVPKPGSNPAWELTRADGHRTVPLAGQISCNCAGLARNLAVLGQGIVAAADVQVADDVRLGRLERVLPAWTLPSTPVYVVTTSRLLPAKARGFIDCLAHRFRPSLRG